MKAYPFSQGVGANHCVRYEGNKDKISPLAVGESGVS